MRESSKPKVVSLFTGAGGLDLGLEQAGFSIIVCLEQEHERCETLNINRPKWTVLEKDIENTSTDEILNAGGLEAGEVDLVSAGSSCQPFSKSAFWIKGRTKQIPRDPRSNLLKHFVRVIREARPRAFLMENVHGLVYKTSRPIFDEVVNLCQSEGYVCSWKVINAADYGVPQKRRRVFLVGSREGIKFNFPPKTHAPAGDQKTGIKSYVTAGEAIGHLDDGTIRDEERVRGKWGHLLPLIPPGENYLYLTERKGHPNPVFRWRSRYWSFLLKLSPTQPSWTIQARPGPYTGPFHWRNRRLRISEIKRLQVFPDNWKLYGSLKSKWAQVGDATPPLVSRVLGEAIIEQILKPRGS